jgi:histidinol-phosphate aminotransferase
MNLDWFFARAGLISGYGNGVTREQLSNRLRVPTEGVLKLDANENLFLPRDLVKAVLCEAIAECDPRLYPSGEGDELRGALADYLRVRESQIVLGAGGDQIIDLVIDSLAEGDELLAVTPTFSMYKATAAKKSVRFNPIEIDGNFALDDEAVLSKASESSRMLVICSPNNPTANQFDKKDVLGLVEEFPGLVLVDEAYGEYAPYTLVGETESYENLMLLKTFSKAFGLAGLRMGYAVANVRLAEVLNTCYQMPYPLSSVALRAGVKILKKLNTVVESVEDTKAERIRLIRELNGIRGVTVFSSDANFVLFDVGDDFDEVYNRLLDRGIMVRRIGRVLDYPGCLRVTVAPRPAMERFLAALKEGMR